MSPFQRCPCKKKKKMIHCNRFIDSRVLAQLDISIKFVIPHPCSLLSFLACHLQNHWFPFQFPGMSKITDPLISIPIPRYEQQKQAYEAGYSAAFLRRGDISPTSLQSGAGASGAGGSSLMVGPIPRHRRRKKDPDMPRRNM